MNDGCKETVKMPQMMQKKSEDAIKSDKERVKMP